MDFENIKNIHIHRHDDDDEHGTKKIVEFLQKFFAAYLDLKKEVERLGENQEKILDFFDKNFSEKK